MNEFIKAFLLIFFAEMGDKTQILAMTLATKHKISKVIIGIFIGVVLNHSLAVLLGAQLGKYLPVTLVGILAGLLFLFFGFSALSSEDDDDENGSKKLKVSIIVSIAITFFMGELGDKTQIAATTLASESLFPLITLAGTVSAMMVTALIGIMIGSLMGNKIPEFFIKITSAVVFIGFGTVKLFSYVPEAYSNLIVYILFALAVAFLFYYKAAPLYVIHKENRATAFKSAAQALYDFKHGMINILDHVCLGEVNCGKCLENKCVIGLTRHIITNIDNPEVISSDLDIIEQSLSKNFNKALVGKSLALIINFLTTTSVDKATRDQLSIVKNNFEKILFGAIFEDIHSKDSYIELLKKEDVENMDYFLTADNDLLSKS